MAGELFTLAGFGEELVQVVTVGGGKCVLGTPHFLKHKVAVGFRGFGHLLPFMPFTFS